MEKINRRFLYYKTYDAFLRDFQDEKILDESIVFVEKTRSIWTHGQEYACIGPNGFNVDNNTLSFKNLLGNVVFTITQDNGDIIFKDSEGNESRQSYVLKDAYESNLLDYTKTEDLGKTYVSHTEFDSAIRQKQNVLVPGHGIDINNNEISSTFTVDDSISSESSNPVQNKVIKLYLDTKANKSDLSSYVKNTDFTTELNKKQNVLRGGRGISIDGDIISSTLDTDVYVFTSTPLSSITNPSPNKIYILESTTDNNTTYSQYKYENDEWVRISDVAPTIDLSEYLKSSIAADTYQPKGSYLIPSDLDPYVKEEDLADIYTEINKYAPLNYVNDTFVHKVEMYFPAQENIPSDYLQQEEVIVVPGAGGSDNPALVVVNIHVDRELSFTSTNPVLNKAITNKLAEYTTTTQLNNAIQEVESKMVTLTTQRYQALVATGMVKENVYYFTYEGEEETTWGFGDTFPITLTDQRALGTFPITLT